MTSNLQMKPAVRFLLIVLASTVFAIVLHQLHHDPLMTLSTKARSVVITSGLFPPVAFGSLAATFAILGLVFLAIQNSLPGTRRYKGALFGIALGGMYVVGMIEAYVVYPVPLFGEIYTGVVDGAGILLMSLLLGRYMADDGPEAVGMEYPVSALLIITACYVAVRYFSYTVLQIESTWATRPLATFLWTAGMGAWVGVMYVLVGRGISPARPARQALFFGGLVFGINWLLFNLFVLLFIQVPLLDLLYRGAFDSAAIVAGGYISSFFSAKARG